MKQSSSNLQRTAADTLIHQVVQIQSKQESERILIVAKERRAAMNNLEKNFSKSEQIKNNI